jgi:hypothetical protein
MMLHYHSGQDNAGTTNYILISLRQNNKGTTHYISLSPSQDNEGKTRDTSLSFPVKTRKEQHTISHLSPQSGQQMMYHFHLSQDNREHYTLSH